jgi:hypothetical protein
MMHIARDSLNLISAANAMPFSDWKNMVAGMHPDDIRPDCLVVSCNAGTTDTGYKMEATFGYGVMQPEPHVNENAYVMVAVWRDYRQGSSTLFNGWTRGCVGLISSDGTASAYDLTSREMLRHVMEKIREVTAELFLMGAPVAIEGGAPL